MPSLIATIIAQVSTAAWIGLVRLDRLDRDTAYRLTIQVKGASPFTQKFQSYDPPNVYTINDKGQGPAVLLQGFDPQADFLTVFAYRSGRWRVSETICARYGITFTHGRQGEVSIEARIPQEFEKGANKSSPWHIVRYGIEQGALVESRKAESR